MNSFTFFDKTEDMKIYFSINGYITLKDIQNEVNKIDYKNIDSITIKKNNYDINFFNVNGLTFSFSIGNNDGINILKEPLTVKISGKKIEFVCSEQLHYFLTKNYIEPKIKCIFCTRIINSTIRCLNQHISHNLIIIESFTNEPLKKDELEKKILKNKKINFLGYIFDSPKSFEKNYHNYFEINNKITFEAPFHIYDDEMKSRHFVVNEFYENISFGKRLNYFGVSGKGKSVTLIGTLKYEIQHDNIGTFYINCKTLKTLSERGLTTKIRNIICDEIEYLFANNYEKYFSCFNKIKTFKITDNYSFWSIISLILEECYNIENKRFIIGFDQYNKLNDINGELNKFEEKYIKENKNKNFKFIVISSMNETDIREQKINYLFDDGILDNYFELNVICNFSSNFTGKELEALEKLGNSFKAFNEIKLIEDEFEINDYLKNKKKKYLYKLISFYYGKKNFKGFNSHLSEEEIMDISEDDYLKLLSFQIDYEYTKDEIKQIIDKIPFRYFNIVKLDKNYIIKVSFPLINDILIDIYKYIIINKNYKAFKILENKKGSAYSTLFEYKVRYKFTPDINGPIKYFGDFDIQDNLKVKVIIPKEKEENNPKFIRALEPSKAYLVEQEVFGGKDLDFLIIYMDINPKVFGFQVSTYKRDIFSNLERTYLILLERLYVFFNVEIKKENAYFGYIFDFSRIKDPLYNSMLRTCYNNNMAYSFYNSDDDCIYINEIFKTHNIYEISCSPLEKSNSYFTRNIQLDNFFTPLKRKFNLTSGNISIIIDILQKEYDAHINSIKYIETKNAILNKPNHLFVSRHSSNNLLIFFYRGMNLVSKEIDISTKKFVENTTYFSNLFDVYEIN